MANTARPTTLIEDSLMSFDVQSTSSQYNYQNIPPSSQVLSFSAFDYCLFSAMLAFSALIGVYFAFCAKQKQNTTSEYLMGGKTMGILPVSLSLIASCVSGITLLGYPAEMYTYGTQYSTTMLGLIIASVVGAIVFMPIFYKLQLNTSYEYLEVRFDRKVRLLGSLLFLLNCLLYIPIVIYIPALAFSQVTGINIHLITPLVCLVCIFYTSLGGLKAVVWTDALQTVMIFVGMIVVIWVGTTAVGGVGEVWDRNLRSGRIEFFNMDPDPTIRHSFWNTVFGSAFAWVSHIAVNQAMVQRFLAMSSIKRAQIMIVAFCFGVTAICVISIYAGLLIYASYYDCDLISAKIVKASDQLLPYFVMDVARSLPGLPGLFMAGVFSAALSSMSTGLNSMAGVIYEDFIDPYLKVKYTEEKASFIMKIICVLIGIFCVGMVFIVENLGAVVQVSWSLGGITTGPMMSVFVLGMFFPWTNAKGTFIGGISGLFIMGYLCFGTQAAIAYGKIKYEKKPVSIEGCAFFPQSEGFTMEDAINASSYLIPSATEAMIMNDTLPVDDEPMPLFRISYTLYSLIGIVVSVAIGLAASALTGPTDPADVHIDLLTPVIRPFYANRCKGGDVMAKRKAPETVEVAKELDEINSLLNNHNQGDNKGKIRNGE